MKNTKVHKMHRLRIWPQHFKEVKNGNKTFEIRKDDRNFQLGDGIFLEEYDPKENKYTGDQVTKIITYIIKGDGFGISKGYCVFGFKNKKEKPDFSKMPSKKEQKEISININKKIKLNEKGN